ncbi:methyltransferase domain-containing protein [Geomicrobium sp. JCM 19039]|uniref:methyltransferase domain-containing protein n=1 Tax=Geomicrobium sp. JCM 19039 TaxID=1460636 RepID=UPI0005A92113|nr:methyltransferase domain-containing protein [Geomicrobium sp. JCM 19039]
MKKIEIATETFREHGHLIVCPACHRNLTLLDKQLQCAGGHVYDLAKKGYVHLLQKAVNSDYTKEMFTARRDIYNQGLYQPMIEHIGALIQRHKEDARELLDVGCGEGSHLASVQRQLEGSIGIGLDLSKDAIQKATDFTENLMWVVANLEQLPVQDDSVDVILNLFSPVNSREFSRVLRSDGFVIKALPGPEYLKELRVRLYGDQIGPLDPTDVIENFERRFYILEKEQVHHVKTVADQHIPALIHMTPVSWDASENRKEQMLRLIELDVTVDVTLLVGKPRS